MRLVGYFFCMSVKNVTGELCLTLHVLNMHIVTLNIKNDMIYHVFQI